MQLNAKIIATGSFLPKKILTNEDLSQIINTNNHWIITRTGIKQRHIADDNQQTSDLATLALENALQSIKLDSCELDAIIVATTTPDLVFPSTAVKVQAKIGAINSFAYDLQAVCSGFIYALEVADSIIKAGKAQKVAVIGAETMSRILNWQDRSTCVLFGDGAGCVILSATEDNSGIIDTKLYSDGNFCNILCTDKGPSYGNSSAYLTMKGGEVFRHAVDKMAKSAQHILDKNNISIKEIDHIIPHQANIRIINAIAAKLGIANEKMVVTVDQHANTSAATIPLALDYINDGINLKPGQKILMTALGGGLTWGAALIEF